MATKTRKQTTTDETVAETVDETPVDEQYVTVANTGERYDDRTDRVSEEDELGYLEAQKKEIAARLKQLKAAAKQNGTPAKRADLPTVITKQRELPGRWVVLGLLSQTQERVAAGQPLDEALAQVTERYTDIVHEVLAMRAEGESLQDATWRHLRESYPKTNARTGPGSTAKAS